jgi:mono/diheme cytochrome c family protein
MCPLLPCRIDTMRLTLVLAFTTLAYTSLASAAETELFESKIRPLLIARCHACHTDMASGGLRLDSRAALLKGGKSGPAVIPGNADSSLLIQAVAHKHASLKMPPAGQLDAQDVLNLATWVKDGVVWPESPREFFISKVKPVFDANCMGCHGDAARAGLKLDSRESVLKGGKSGPALVPGDPQKSLLMQAVRQDHDTLKMPPAGRLSDENIANLGKWVKDGAIWPEVKAPEVPVYNLRPDQKAFWSFQPIRRLAAPQADKAEWNRNPIDQFIYAKLKEKGLTPGKKADRATLLRRATFDLTGLPATREDIAAFVADQSPGAFEKRIDKMLASQQYGERWGRHWLDLVRYADTAGDSGDFPVPEMYKYRNYVIDSFLKDKPYDQFLREQIAGDLLPAATEAQRWEQTIGTGYITVSRRIGVSPTGERHVMLEDTIGNFGQSMLGLSVGCARCHDHKFDPIPTADYYALYGIFDSTTYPLSGEEHNPYRRDVTYRAGKEKAAEILKPFDEAFAPWKKLERDKFNEYQEFQDKKILTPGRSREVVWKELIQVRAELKTVAETYPPLETAWAAAEGKPHDVKIQVYGEPKNTTALVRRGFPLILGGMKVPESETGSGRLELSQWLTDPKNPLPARVIVNRIWHYHFGKGIVSTTSDFGVRGTLPTHPELLDYLASRFMEDGWSIKKMHKLILLSDTYQLASAEVPGNSATDPQNSYLWRQNRQRLDAEEITDSIRLLSGTLDLSMGERHPFPNDRTYFYRQHEPFTGVFDNPRRAVYGMQQRIVKNPYLDLFDGPDGNLPMAERRSTTTSLQALYLMNSEFLTQQSAIIADKALAAGKTNPARIVWAYETIFGREPKAAETAQSEEFLKKLPWPSYIHSMLSSNPFLFVD